LVPHTRLWRSLSPYWCMSIKYYNVQSEKQDERVSARFMWHRRGTSNGNEHSGSIKCREFLTYLREC
jgi:hypothetical protein